MCTYCYDVLISMFVSDDSSNQPIIGQNRCNSSSVSSSSSKVDWNHADASQRGLTDRVVLLQEVWEIGDQARHLLGPQGPAHEVAQPLLQLRGAQVLPLCMRRLHP